MRHGFPCAAFLGLTLSSLAAAPQCVSAASVANDEAAIATPRTLPPMPAQVMDFQPNVGQFDARVAFTIERAGIESIVTRDGALVHRLPADAARDWILVERFGQPIPAGSPVPKGDGPASTGVTRLAGEHAAALSDSTYRRVDLGESWPGVRTELVARATGIEKRFRVAPGVSAARIRVDLAGVEGIEHARDGRLLLATGPGTVALSAPLAWQDIDGARRAVEVAYTVHDGAAYGFRLGRHDRRHGVTIDPILRSTFVGGSSTEQFFTDIEVADDSVYIAGFSQSANFPGTSGGYQSALVTNTSLGGNQFIARYSLDLTTLLQSTYYGAYEPISGGMSRTTDARELAVDADGVYLVGQTPDGSTTIVPGTAGGAQPASGGRSDGFAARFARDLRSLQQATFFGGAGDEAALAVALSSDAVYIGGSVFSTTAAPLPGTAGAAITTYSNSDGFVARLTRDLRTLVRATLVTGSPHDGVLALATDGTDVYAAGGTAGALTQTTGAFQPARGSGGGFTDGYVVRLDAALTSIARSTFLGGSGHERVDFLTLTPSSVYASGFTASGNFPVGPVAADGSLQGATDLFALALTRDLSTRNGGTFSGGSGSEGGGSLAVVGNSVFLAGTTNATDLPGTAGGAEANNPNAQTTGFVGEFDLALTTLRQASYYGTTTPGTKQLFGLSANADTVYIAGSTQSATLPGTAGSAQPNTGGGFDHFIAAFRGGLSGPRPPSDLAATKSGGDWRLVDNRYVLYRVTFANFGTDPAVAARFVDTLPADTLSAANWSCVGTNCPAASGSGSLDFTRDLPTGASMAFDFCARHIGSGADVVNTATASVSGANMDPVAGNNAATHVIVDPSLFNDGFEERVVPALCPPDA